MFWFRWLWIFLWTFFRIVTLPDTNLEDSNDSSYLFEENSSSFLKVKGFVTHCYTHDPTIFMKERLHFPYGFSLEDPESLDVCVLLTLLHSAFFLSLFSVEHQPLIGVALSFWYFFIKHRHFSFNQPLYWCICLCDLTSIVMKV